MAPPVTGMVSELTSVRKGVCQRKLQVTHDVGIGILIDGDRGGGMRAIDHAQALLDAAFAHRNLDLRRDVDEAIRRRLQFESFHACLPLK